jgi:hypothetical protein
MVEKKGSTVKLEYTFDVSGEMEIFLPDGNNWYRVTARTFRSFDGRRRLNNQEYEGPIYIFNTNTKIDKSRYPTHKIVDYDLVSKKREHESFNT